MKKSSPKPIDILVTHLYRDDNNLLTDKHKQDIHSGNRCLVDTIGLQLAKRLKDTDSRDNVLIHEHKDDNSKQLKHVPNEKSANLKNFYEDDQLFRYSGSLSYRNRTRDLAKIYWTSVCHNPLLANTLTSIDLNGLKHISGLDRIIPRLQFESIKSFSLGSLIDLTHFVEHYTSESDGALNVAKDDIMADFQMDRNRLIIRFRVTSGGRNGKHTENIRYKCDFEFQAFHSAAASLATREESGRAQGVKVMRIYITLTHPPLLYKHQIDSMTVEEEMMANVQYTRGQKFSKRKIYKTIESDKGVHNNEVQNYHTYIRDNEFYGCSAETIGKSNVLMLEIPLIEDAKKLRDKYRELPDPYRILYLLKRCIKIPVSFSYIQTHECVEQNIMDIKNKCHVNYPFNIEYAFLSVFSNAFQASDELFFKNQTKLFIETVDRFWRIDSKATEDTLFELSALIDRNAIFCTMKALEMKFEEFKDINEKTKHLDSKPLNIEIEEIRRCILTPTRFIILPPQPTLKSRFIADNEADYTIRLSVREDDLKPLQFTVRLQNESQSKLLEKMISKPIMKGITLGDRKYDFLGSSSSQLREAGMILYAKDPDGRTAHSIREGIGDLSKIRKNVAKYVARLGLAFSQVMTHIEVNQSDTEVIADIKSETKKLDEDGQEMDDYYVFSDGIGKVSKEIMEEVYTKLVIECKQRPSAMQIRYGGCKGMLVVDPNLKGRKIQFRESMEKYKSKTKQLGIIKMSAPRPLHLNRPFITILEHLKDDDKDNIFQHMLLDDLRSISDAMVCECAATKLLQNSSTLCIPYRKLYKSGIPFLSEPLFRQILESVINYRIDELKRKTRIRVPMRCGRTVFGVLDETGTLEYGQVFVQVSKVDEDNMPTNEDPLILSGEVMVTKFPCLHPGDVRKFKAVDVEALHHIKDCIVFPQKGKRPHPDEMAGSDLDGDEYGVIWDSPLIFDGPNKEPMLFPTSIPMKLDHDAQVKDILDFYCKYIVGNNVGLLASAHLAQADKSDDGIDNEVCMSLAKKYAVSLDFAKTGRVATIFWRERPFMYPDFMDKFSMKRTYLSKKILGQLYRHCDRFSLGFKTGKDLEISAEPNPCLKIDDENWELYKKSALKAYEDYKRKIEYLMNRFGVDNEAKLLSGSFSKSTKYMNGRTETNDVHELLENMINKLFIEFKDRFNNECLNEDNTGEERKLRAKAWYSVPFKLNEPLVDRYFGFSWTITEEICIIMSDRNKSNNYNKEDHKCVKVGAQLIQDFFEAKFIYPSADMMKELLDSANNESDKRQIIMQENCNSAETVLRAWLERQDHLFFKRKIGRKVLSSTDCEMSDMQFKLRRRLQQKRVELMSEAMNALGKPLPSAGELVMNFFTQCINDWLNHNQLDENNRIVDTPLVKLGFSALITLNHFFKSREICHIVYVGSKFKVALKTPIRDETFFVPLPKIIGGNNLPAYKIKNNEYYRKYVEYMVQHPEVFCEKLKVLSGAIEVYLEPYPMPTKKLEHFYMMTATGSVWSLQAIKNFICHPSFFKAVPNCDVKWKKKNIYLKGMKPKELAILPPIDESVMDVVTLEMPGSSQTNGNKDDYKTQIKKTMMAAFDL